MLIVVRNKPVRPLISLRPAGAGSVAFMGGAAAPNAATVHRSKQPEGHLRPVQRVTIPNGYAVPGWTDEQTRYWLNNATA
jgi:hypothetical protein